MIVKNGVEEVVVDLSNFKPPGQPTDWGNVMSVYICIASFPFLTVIIT